MSDQGTAGAKSEKSALTILARHKNIQKLYMTILAGTITF